MAAIVAAVLVIGPSGGSTIVGLLVVLLAGILFFVGLTLFARGKGYSALSIVIFLVVPTVIAAFLPWPESKRLGVLITVCLVAILPDKTVAESH